MIHRPAASPLRIAVVDDEEIVRKSLQRLLLSFGFEVACYASGDEFLTRGLAVLPDCVVLDINMPVLDGFGVVEALMASSLPIAVILMTGYDSTEARERAALAQVSAFMRKPIDGDELVTAIRAAIRTLDC